MKRCVGCGEHKEPTFFHRDKSRPDGLRNRCKPCASLAARKWQAENPLRVSEYRAERYHIDREQENARRRARKEWGRENRARRRASLERAIPSWYGELDKLVFSEAYELAKRREVVTGGKWHVDHVLPIRGKTVCGLHVALNVAVIPARANLVKGNRA